MTPNTINKLVNKALAENKDPGQYVADFVQQEQTIRLKIQLRRNDIKAIQKQRDEEISELHRQIIEIRHTCPHVEFTYYGDPSGGSDSHYTCDWCGKEW